MFSLQDRANVLSQQTLSTGADITFTLAVERDASGRVLGKFAMGAPAQRFYLQWRLRWPVRHLLDEAPEDFVDEPAWRRIA